MARSMSGYLLSIDSRNACLKIIKDLVGYEVVTYAERDASRKGLHSSKLQFVSASISGVLSCKAGLGSALLLEYGVPVIDLDCSS